MSVEGTGTLQSRHRRCEVDICGNGKSRLEANTRVGRFGQVVVIDPMSQMHKDIRWFNDNTVRLSYLNDI